MFSKSTKYALRTVLFLNRNRADQEKFKVEDIAQQLEIPQAFLSKIMQQLAKNDIVSSSKGRGGGFYLSDSNIDRPLLDIIVCIEGHDVFSNCILGLKECGDKAPCYLHQYYKTVKADLQSVITNTAIKNIENQNILNLDV